MRGDEVRARKAIAVEEHAIASGTGADAAVADFATAKTVMLLPHVL